MSTLVIDIGGTKIATALISDDNQITLRKQVPTPASSSPAQLIDTLQLLIIPLLPSAKRVAVASTGIIHDGILTAINPDNLGGLKNFPLQQVIEKISHLPCWLLNDAQAAAWAEYQYRKLTIQDMAFITISTGVGGGIILNDHLLMGPRGIAGHLGHTLADPNGPLCGCGRTGCVEAIASGRAISRLATKELAGLDTKTIFSHYYSGNKQAEDLIHHSAQTIANLCLDIKASMDVDCIVIGGSIGLADGYIQLIQNMLSKSSKSLQVDVLPAHFHNDAGLWGAVFWAREQ